MCHYYTKTKLAKLTKFLKCTKSIKSRREINSPMTPMLMTIHEIQQIVIICNISRFTSVNDGKVRLGNTKFSNPFLHGRSAGSENPKKVWVRESRETACERLLELALGEFPAKSQLWWLMSWSQWKLFHIL